MSPRPIASSGAADHASSVEGVISSAKRVEGIGQLRTCSRTAAYRELVFKAIAHNLRRTLAIIAAAKLKASSRIKNPLATEFGVAR
jgi:hypothetical protein